MSITDEIDSLRRDAEQTRLDCIHQIDSILVKVQKWEALGIKIKPSWKRDRTGKKDVFRALEDAQNALFLRGSFYVEGDA